MPYSTSPAELLGQRVNLDFALTFSPRQLCSPTIAPLTFQLDPRSTLTMRRGGQALGGFGAVPSEFSPEFLVALDGGSPNQLDYATRVVGDIARRTGTTLMPRVVDVEVRRRRDYRRVDRRQRRDAQADVVAPADRR